MEPAVEGISGEAVPGEFIRTLGDGTQQQRYYGDCFSDRWGWVNLVDDNGTLVPLVTPQDLIPIAYARAVEILPDPIPRIGPADSDPQGFAYVQIPTVFWVDQAPGQWAPVSATASVAGLSLTATATPVSLHVDTGDGGSVDCPGDPPPFRPELDDIERFRGCTYTYRNSSAMSSNGATYPVTVTITWNVTWSASTGESGDLGTLTTMSGVRELPVAEIQAVIIAD